MKQYIYCINVTKFKEEHEIEVDYISIACYSSLKKACKELMSSLIIDVYTEKSVEDEGTLDMKVWYTDDKGRRTLETIEQKLLY